MSFRWWRVTEGISNVTLLTYATIFVMLVSVGALEPRFFNLPVLAGFVSDVLPLALASIAQSLVVIVGGFDLSVGPLLSLVNAIAARSLAQYSGPALPAAVIGLVMLSAVMGAVNGLLTIYGRLQPLVVTLATGAVFSGLALLVLPVPGGSIPASLSSVFTGTTGGVPNAAILLVLSILLVWEPLRLSRWGLYMRAAGDDPASAQLSGVPINRARLLAYTLSGLFTGLAGVSLTANVASGDPRIGLSYTLMSVAAVALGGGALGGGFGGAIGPVGGALLQLLLVQLVFFLGLSSFYQELFHGLILLGAVAAAAAVRRGLKR